MGVSVGEIELVGEQSGSKGRSSATGHQSGVALLQQVVPALAAADSLDAAVTVLLDIFARETPWQAGCLWQRDGERGRWGVALHRQTGDPAQIAPWGGDTAATDQEWQLVTRVATTATPQWAELDAPAVEGAEAACTAVGYAFPVVHQDQVVAVIEVVSFDPQVKASGFEAIAPLLATQLGLVRRIEQLDCQVATAAERQRERLGEAMHDGLGQQIAGIAMLADVVARRHEGQEVAAELQAIAKAANDAKEQARWLTRGLLPMEVEPEGLVEALRELAAQTEACWPVRCEVVTDGALAPADPKTATHLYWIAKEGVHNAVKHAGAERILLSLDGEEGGRLRVVDDGEGVAPEPHRSSDGNGFRIMRNRAESIGWKLRVAPGTPQGTVVCCWRG